MIARAQPRSIIAGAETSTADVIAATTAAAEAFASYRATSHEPGGLPRSHRRRDRGRRTRIVEAAVAESHLPEGRITGEVGRTTGQLRMFAGVVRRGDHLGVRIDPASPTASRSARRHPPAA